MELQLTFYTVEQTSHSSTVSSLIQSPVENLPYAKDEW